MNNKNLTSSAAFSGAVKGHSYYPWTVAVAGFFLVSILYGTYYCFGVFFKPMLKDLNCTRAMLSGALALYMVVHGASSIIMGFLCDKYGPRYVIMVSVFLIAIGYCMISRVTALWHMYLYFGIIVGIGMGAGYVPPVATVTKWFIDDKRGLALGVVASGVGVGQMIMPPFISHMITVHGWRTSFIIMGVLVLIFGIIPTFFLKNPEKSNEPLRDNDVDPTVTKMNQAEPKSFDWTVAEAIATPSFWILLFIFTFLVIGVGIVNTHIVAHVEDIGIDPMSASFMLTLIGGSGIFGRIIIGGLADKIGNRIMLNVCLIPLVIVLLFLSSIREIWAFYLIAVFFGLLYGGALPVIIKMSSAFYGVNSAGAIFGIIFFGATFGGAVGAPLAGYIYDLKGSYFIAFLLGSAVFCVASILSLIIKSPRKKQGH